MQRLNMPIVKPSFQPGHKAANYISITSSLHSQVCNGYQLVHVNE